MPTSFRASIAHEGELQVAPAVREALEGRRGAAERVCRRPPKSWLRWPRRIPASAMAGLPAFMKQFEALEGAMEDVTNVMSADAEASVVAANANAGIAMILIAVVIAARPPDRRPAGLRDRPRCSSSRSRRSPTP